MLKHLNLAQSKFISNSSEFIGDKKYVQASKTFYLFLYSKWRNIRAPAPKLMQKQV